MVKPPQDAKINQRIYRVLGLRRSGNHAVISWLKQNLDYENYLFLNECTPGRVPNESFTEIEFNDQHIGPKNFDRTRALMFASKAPECDVLIFSYEDPLIKKVFERKVLLSANYDRKIHYNIVLYREFLNWIASYHALQTRRTNTEENTVGRLHVLFTGIYAWMEMVNLIHSQAFQKQSKYVAVQYDDWFSDAALRRGLAQKIELDRCDPTLPAVSQYGGGSSFEKNTAPQDLKIDQRWQAMRDNPKFKEILGLAMRDPNLDALLRKRFPETRTTISEAFGF